MRISLIAAVAENGIIGNEGEMPWRLSEDLKWFKKNTLGKPVLMGRKTFESIGRALPGRLNVVISRTEKICSHADDVIFVPSIEVAIEAASLHAANNGGEEICIIGGGEIYAQTLGLASRLYLTRVMAKPQGDTLFPELDSRDWSITRQGVVPLDAKNTHTCEFFIFDKVDASTKKNDYPQ